MSEEQAKFNLLSIARHALAMVRPFLKLDGEQSAAWSVVEQLLGGGTSA